MSDYKTFETDVLVIGSGGAALRAVLAASDEGAEVTVLVKNNFRKSGATFYSVAEVGAYNVPDGAGDPADNPDVFREDILKAAQGMADPRLVDILVNESEPSLRYLEKFGVHFERNEDRYLAFRACFSSKPRSHVLKDHFKPIMRALGEEATRRGVRALDRMMVVGLVSDGTSCHGAMAIDDEGGLVFVRAKSVILTTGGASQLFSKNLYPADITGDGYAMAWRAGAELANMEFMQAGVSIIDPFINLFGNYLWDAHPKLTDRDGVPFVESYLPAGLTVAEVMQEKERHFPFSSSDISRYIEISIQRAINEGRGTDKGGVYMDFKNCDFDRLLADKTRSFGQMWPLTYEWYKERGTDLYKDAVQITCSAHAINGGLRINENGETTLKGLFAAGETAAGPHGADRLGGNMAMTCQVFGARAGKAAAERCREVGVTSVGDGIEAIQAYLAKFSRTGGEDGAAIRLELQAAANRSLLILRNEPGLSQFLSELTELQARLQAVSAPSRDNFVHAIETDNLIETGRMMTRAALLRTESRGSHFREDAPSSNENFAVSYILSRGHESGGYFASLGTL
ncbi:L-aspartate oxidase [Agrobacterium salinitolerans]|uniref:FAD-binding protein n=1 Tax=Agrobacterium salinitolerans TaxID=1183413 RepID=UPI00098F3D52|nr:FAD-binding protein [Agrobacterium salinitolerans]OOO27885.1 L-aspartate oxidase [Agrobacterium salinitolerans]PNQ25784.1 FAD-binding protein [Rhizobium sp. YIC5082]